MRQLVKTANDIQSSKLKALLAKNKGSKRYNKGVRRGAKASRRVGQVMSDKLKAAVTKNRQSNKWRKGMDRGIRAREKQWSS